MQIGPMTAEEWARDTFRVILLSENPVAVVQALVERIHRETVQQCAGHAATADIIGYKPEVSQ